MKYQFICFISGWVGLLDSLVRILSFGFCCSEFGKRMSDWYAKKEKGIINDGLEKEKSNNET